MAIVPADIPTGLVIGQFYFVDEDNIDADTDPELTAVTGTVTFTASRPVFHYASAKGVATIVPMRFDGKFDATGRLVSASDPTKVGIELPATDSELLGVTGFTWRVDFSLVEATTRYTVNLPSFDIQVPAGQTIDLTAVAPVATSPGVLTLRGPEGPAGADLSGGVYATHTEVTTASTADRARANHTGTQSADTVIDGNTNKAYTAVEKTKLAGIATAATANATDASLRDRSTHTGTQTAATISDFSEAAQDAVAAMLSAGTGVTLTYNDAGNTLTVTSTATGGITDPEVVRDTIGAALIGVGLVSVAVNDAADTITISTTATANSTDAQLRDRATHTGSQAISTVTGLQSALDGKADAGSFGGTGTPVQGQAVVYSAAYPFTIPAENTAQGIYVCSGTADDVKINAAITATGRGQVLLAGPSFSTTAPIRMKTGIWLAGGSIGTQITPASDFNDGIVVLDNTSVHGTTLSGLTLNGNGRAVKGVYYFSDATGVFSSAPATSPDAVHYVHNLYILNCGNSTYAGHGMHLKGANLRACRYRDIRILACSGVGVWNDANADSHFVNVEVGSSGKNGPAVSTSSAAPVGQGFFNGGANHMVSNCKAWYSRADGFYNAGVRNSYSNCQAQDNYGHGFKFYYGKSNASGCQADSNGQGLAAGGLGTAGFWIGSDSLAIVGCVSYDRGGQAWQQQYGYQFTSGMTYGRVIGCTSYTNATASQTGTPGTGNTVDVQADANGK